MSLNCDPLYFLGELLNIWIGSYIGVGEYVGILAVVVQGGYYSVTKYKWEYNGVLERSEIYPILYATKREKFSCIAEVQGQYFTFTFTVKGNATLS